MVRENEEESGGLARSPSPPLKRPKARRNGKNITSLAEAGALPPASDDDVIGDDDAPARDVEVMSEPPEIDTTRFDGPPLVKICGIGCQPIATRLMFVVVVLILLPILGFGICFLFRTVRNNSPMVDRLVNESTAILCNSVHKLCVDGDV